MTPPQVAGRIPLVGFYMLYFGSVGVTQPFLPAYLRSLALSTTQVGLLLALSPLMSLVAPPLWGHLADRTGKISHVLTLLVVGAALGFSPLLGVSTFPALVATLAVYACFASSITPMVDSLALNRVAQVGGNYAHLRLFGSVGFILCTVSFGLVAKSVGQLAVLAPLVLLSTLAVWSLTLRSRTPLGGTPHPLAGLRLLRDNKDLRWLLAATSLHWMACTPYNGMLAIHVLALGLPPSVVGLSAGAGVAAEVAALLLYPRLAHRIAPRHLLGLAFFVSALRWVGMAFATSPVLLVALALLHSMTFGVFYVGSVAFMARRVPQHLRASGQGIFAAVTFGVGGLVGFAASGAGYALLGGGHGLFGVAALLEVVAAVLVLQASPSPKPLPKPDEPIQAAPP
ncbi:MFS transporter [Hyalangium rubrum]|uniref:MFS transporter n=1 Tax=Hyalangium rubrum TaxID=3103134 RepID=A0ABU5HCA1_9BACT|nr:MFS transporter [Hyalangium sp. s54d21]MDY7230910.1 MFS transporter [Hyalangium sp. s54d21]